MNDQLIWKNCSCVRHEGHVLWATSSNFKIKLEGLSNQLPPTPTLIFDLDLPKFKHLVPYGQGYDW